MVKFIQDTTFDFSAAILGKFESEFTKTDHGQNR